MVHLRPISRGAVMTRWQGDAGFTLIEMLIAALITAVIVGGLLTFMVVSLDQGDAVVSRAYSAIQAQTGLAKLTQDLSEAIASNQVTMSQTSTTATATFDIPDPSNADAAESVTWTCPYSASPSVSSVGACTRQVGSGSAESAITGIESASFAPASSTGSAIALTSTPTALSPAYIGITLDVRDSSQLDRAQATSVLGITNPIVVKSGVDLRNFS